MRDLAVSQDTKQILIKNDLEIVTGNEQLRQFIWSTITSQLENYIIDVYGIETVVLGKKYDQVDLQSIIYNMLINADDRISKVDIISRSFDAEKRNLFINLSITTSDDEKITVGGNLND